MISKVLKLVICKPIWKVKFTNLDTFSSGFNTLIFRNAGLSLKVIEKLPSASVKPINHSRKILSFSNLLLSLSIKNKFELF